jgi:transcriptional regulator with XRE-family HTH domain
LLPGLRLRQVRERLGLTYRDVEAASYELAGRRGRPEFVLHISRLADIENRNVIPSLHKLYSLAVIYHLNPLQIFAWYEVPFEECFEDGLRIGAPHTHLAAPPNGLKVPLRFDPAFDPRRTDFLSRMVERWGHFEGALVKNSPRHCYGYIGLSDRRMGPLLRPGSLVLIDTEMRQIEDANWVSEHDRPMYLVDVRNGYRCGWFSRANGRLTMHPHPLSRCAPESWSLPNEAEVIGKVIGVVSRLNESWSVLNQEYPEERAGLKRRAL